MIQFWRDSDTAERVAIVGVAVVLLEFIVGWGYLLHLAAQLDAMDAMRK